MLTRNEVRFYSESRIDQAFVGCPLTHKVAFTHLTSIGRLQSCDKVWIEVMFVLVCRPFKDFDDGFESSPIDEKIITYKSCSTPMVIWFYETFVTPVGCWVESE